MRNLEELFDLIRIDDNGVEYEMLHRIDRGTAEKLKAWFEAQGHKQTYLIRSRSSMVEHGLGKTATEVRSPAGAPEKS